MERDQQQQQQSQQRQSEENNSSPENPNTSHQFSQASYSQFRHQDYSLNQSVAGVASTLPESGHASTPQPPPFASTSQAESDDSNKSKNMYAIQTSLTPVARESNDDSPFLQSLDKLFGAQGNDDVAAARASTNEVPLIPQQLGSAGLEANANKVSNGKGPNLKSPPVKAAAGKIKTAVGGSKSRRQAKADSDQIAPYDYLKNMLAERGYSFATIKSTEAGYMTEPSPLQLASFGTKLVNAVHTSDVTLLSSLLGCGLSPNPCNQFRDSVMDWACRKANDTVFQCFIDHNVDLRVCDGFGRTPLHHSAWADTFSPNIAHSILQRDLIQLFLKDNAGRTPLEYVPAKLATQWVAFLNNHKEAFFPINGPPLAVTKRQHLQLPDPPNAISVDLARLLTAGHIMPEQIGAMDVMTRKTWKLPK